MNGLRNAVTTRLTQSTLATLALLTHGALAFTFAPLSAGAQGGGAVGAQRVLVTTKDSTRRGEYFLVGFPARVDSLIKRLNALPIGSAEYFATEDTLRVEFRKLPQPLTGQREFTVTAKVAPQGIRLNAMDVIPTGWFGFTADGLNDVWDAPAGTMIRHYEYPTVVVIEANSPASRAGMRSGDSLLAYDGRDLRANLVNLTRLLVPGREVSIRLRREGEQKEVVLTVDKAPPALMAERRAAAAGAMVAVPGAPGVPFHPDSMERRLVEMRVAETQVAAAAAGRFPTAPSKAPPRAVQGGYISSRAPVAAMGGPVGVLGAAMTNVDADMSESIVGMKGKRGVFVTTVPAGSIAERTGLKTGDVILRIEAADVFSVAQLRSRLEYAEMNHVEKVRVTILRKGKTEDLVYDPR